MSSCIIFSHALSFFSSPLVMYRCVALNCDFRAEGSTLYIRACWKENTVLQINTDTANKTIKCSMSDVSSSLMVKTIIDLRVETLQCPKHQVKNSFFKKILKIQCYSNIYIIKVERTETLSHQD